MKRIPWISIASLTAVMLLGASIATLSPSPARADALTCVDDPPPDPTECPFCGGNPELHRVRLRALLRLSAAIFESAVP
ncbi:MAG: hypothetical protein U1F29_08790 [Planctomycetota bacterium]